MKSPALWLALLVVVMVAAAPVPASAFTPRAGDTVIISEAIDDDLYAAGATVEVAAPVDGDVVAAGGTVTVSGPVSGGILAAGGTLRVAGEVGRSVRAGGGTISLASRVESDAVLAGGTVRLEEGGTVGRDLVATGGTVRLEGAVGRRAYLSGGTVVIAGNVEGDVTVDADRLVVLPAARIQGRLSYAASRVDIQSGAQIAGGTERRVAARPRPMFRTFPFRGFPFRLAWRVVEVLWLLAMGLVLLAIAPRGMTRVAERIARAFGYSLLTGFILLVVLPVAAVLIAFTLVGIPLAGVLMLLYVASLITAQVFPAAWIGRWALGRARPGGAPSPYWAQVIGTLILVLLIAVPFLGWLVRLVAVLLGLGALWAAVWATRRPGPPGMAAAPAAPAGA